MNSVFDQFLKLFKLNFHDDIVNVIVALDLDLEVVNVIGYRLLLEERLQVTLTELRSSIWCIEMLLVGLVSQ